MGSSNCWSRMTYGKKLLATTEVKASSTSTHTFGRGCKLPTTRGGFFMSYSKCLPMWGSVVWEAPLKSGQLFFSNTVSTLCSALHHPLKETVLLSLNTMIQCVPVGSEKDSFLQLSGDLMRQKGHWESLTQSISLPPVPPWKMPTPRSNY